tara:strand:- start:109 stop:285 length:177 start_codon:yes stop_codon:yes gene_type:complete
MQVGDIVRGWLTEQIGIVLEIGGLGAVRVIWTTQGDSLFGPGSTEWCDERSLDLLTTA